MWCEASLLRLSESEAQSTTGVDVEVGDGIDPQTT